MSIKLSNCKFVLSAVLEVFT
jgi:hypothetical protein